MSITYPLSLPASPNFKDITLRKTSVTSDPMSPYTLESQVQVYDGQRWAADLTLPVLTNAQSAQWEAFLAKLNGYEGTFLLGDPGRTTPRGSASSTPGTPVVNGSVTARNNSLSVSGLPVLTAGYLLTGDLIQIESGEDTRLHQVLDQVDTDSNGEATITIWPATRKAYSGGETITVSAAKGLFRLAESTHEYFKEPGNPTTGALTRLSFSAAEAL